MLLQGSQTSDNCRIFRQNEISESEKIAGRPTKTFSRTICGKAMGTFWVIDLLADDTLNLAWDLASHWASGHRGFSRDFGRRHLCQARLLWKWKSVSVSVFFTSPTSNILHLIGQRNRWCAADYLRWRDSAPLTDSVVWKWSCHAPI